MLTARELAAALFGVWRLARLDSDGLKFFPDSLEGFWRSFWAAAIIAPAYLLLVGIHLAGGEVERPWRFVPLQVIGYVISWVAYPLVMAHLVRLLDREPRYFRYMCAYNWFHLAQTALLLPVSLLGAAGILPEGLLFIIGMAALSAILMYQWFIAVHGLAIDGMAATGLVMIDLLLSLLVNGIAEGMA